MSYSPNSVYKDIAWTRKFGTHHLFSPHVQTNPPTAGDTNSDRKVCIIGGGLAGLTAAYELTKAKYAVTVLEASSRIGGRVWTHRFRGPGGAEVAFGELGAMRIPHDHELVFRYVAELGLPKPKRFVNTNYNGFLHVGGRPFRRWQHEAAARHLWRAAHGAFPERLRKDPVSLIQNASEGMKAPLTEAAMYSIFDSDLNKSLAPNQAKEVMASRFLQSYESSSLWQQMTQPQEVGKRRFTPQEWDVLSRLTLEHPWEQVSLLEWLIDDIAIHGRKFELVGGMDTLPAAMAHHARSNGGRIVQDALVVEVGMTNQPEGKKVEVFWEDLAKESSPNREQYDYVICAAPAPATSRIRFKEMTVAKQSALTSLTYMPAAKALVLCDKRHWELRDDIAGGSSISDQGNQQSWYPSDNALPDKDKISTASYDETGAVVDYLYWSPDRSSSGLALSNQPGCFLGAYMWGNAAMHFGSLDTSERRRFVLDRVRKYHEWIEPATVLDVETFSWDDVSSPGGGAFACFAPGEHSRYQAALEEPLPENDPRIFFAGEHLAVLHGWMQGALQSGLAAARRVAQLP